MKKSFLIFLLLLMISSFNSFAQIAGFNFTLGFPTGEFKNNVKRTGFGASGEFLLFTPSVQNPFSIGLNVGFINYGSESREEPFSSTIPDVIVNVDRSNNIVNFHVLFQLTFPTGIIRPYAEGLFGGSYIYTQTSVKSNLDEIASTTNFDDFAWSYGAGGGLLIQVFSPDEPISKLSSVFIDLKVRYLYGSEAEYLKQGSVSINRNGGVTYYTSKSKTDLLTANIGAVVYFNSLFNN